MNTGRPGIAEAFVAILIPPACREEIVGDLHERYRSPFQYAGDVLQTVPLVILSRIRRTSDPRIVLMQAMALYVSFCGADWLRDGTILREQLGLLRLAIPAAMILLGILLDDAYAIPGRRSVLSLVRGPLVGVGLALASQELLWATNPNLAIPHSIAYYGCAISFGLTSAVRQLFPPVTNHAIGANVPAFWLKQSAGNSEGTLRVSKSSWLLLLLAIAAVFFLAHKT
jgi:hypothetical protein